MSAEVFASKWRNVHSACLRNFGRMPCLEAVALHLRSQSLPAPWRTRAESSAHTEAVMLKFVLYCLPQYRTWMASPLLAFLGDHIILLQKMRCRQGPRQLLVSRCSSLSLVELLRYELRKIARGTMQLLSLCTCFRQPESIV